MPNWSTTFAVHVCQTSMSVMSLKFHCKLTLRFKNDVRKIKLILNFVCGFYLQALCSMYLYCIFINELIRDIDNDMTTISINRLKVGAIAYVDDIAPVSVSS